MRTLIAVILVLALAAYLAYRFVFPVPRFPQPTGEYAIGTRRYHWVDASRPDPFVPGSDSRELMVQVWYPAASRPRGDPAPYLSSAALRDAVAAFFRLPGFLLRNVQNAPTHAFVDAPPAAWSRSGGSASARAAGRRTRSRTRSATNWLCSSARPPTPTTSRPTRCST